MGDEGGIDATSDVFVDLWTVSENAVLLVSCMFNLVKLSSPSEALRYVVEV
jgi:hypothetical protein